MDATLWKASFKLTLYGCVVSVYCIGFAYIDVICVNFMIVPEILVCSSFLISVVLCFVPVMRGCVWYVCC